MVLIIDDRPENLLGLRKLLESGGFKVNEALSGEEALKKALKNEYCVIILDVQMPGMDGFEVAESLSGLNKTKDIPIIFLSAVNTEKKFISKGYMAGAYDYIVKPFDPDILLMKVRNLYMLCRQHQELKKIKQQLENEIEIRKEAERKKDEFLSIASHELKTPLTSMKGYIQVLKKSLDNNPKEKNKLYLERAEYQSNRLNLLINDLFDLSNIEAGKFSLKKEKFSFRQMLTNITENFSYTFPGYEMILTGDVSGNLVADQARIEQVIMNYLSNAVKYSPLSKAINLSVTISAGNHLRVRITDKGVGIAAEKLPMLFQKFYRADESSNRFQGLGIGLFISSQIIKMHGGEYGAESIEGEGSVFYFSIPVAET